jgi:hypothetical protein
MRTLTIIQHISLDGVIQHSADGGAFPCDDWKSRAAVALSPYWFFSSNEPSKMRGLPPILVFLVGVENCPMERLRASIMTDKGAGAAQTKSKGRQLARHRNRHLPPGREAVGLPRVAES